MITQERESKAEEREGDRIAQYVALGLSGLSLLTTWFVVLTNQPTKVGWFAFHPTLQTLAMFMFTYGVVTLQPTSQPRTKAAGLNRHQTAIFYLALPIITLGTLSIMYNKWLRGAEHITTWHGTFGILSVMWILVQAAFGGASVWFDGAAFGGGLKAKSMWKYHRLSGYVLFFFLLLSVNLGGAWSNWGQRNCSYGVRLVAYIVSPAAILTAVYSRARLSKMKFF